MDPQFRPGPPWLRAFPPCISFWIKAKVSSDLLCLPLSPGSLQHSGLSAHERGQGHFYLGNFGPAVFSQPSGLGSDIPSFWKFSLTGFPCSFTSLWWWSTTTCCHLVFIHIPVYGWSPSRMSTPSGQEFIYFCTTSLAPSTGPSWLWKSSASDE